MMRLAWHEGADLLKVREIGGGPGRGLEQFEPSRAKEALDYAFQKKGSQGWWDLLVTAAGVSSQVLKEEMDKLPAYGTPSARQWPMGSKVEVWLAGAANAPQARSDYSGAVLTRTAFKKVPASIPATLEGHAKYWAKYWLGNEDSPKKQDFVGDSNRLEQLGALGFDLS